MKFGQLFTQLSLLGILVLGGNAFAQTEVYRARLSPMPTTPQTKAEIIGGGEVILTLEGSTLTVNGNFKGMSSAATAAHIHSGPPAQPGPVIHTLIISDSNSGEISGVLELTPDQITELKANSLYVQVHSASNPSGELRGWVFTRSHFN
jgi:hypothetical protein